MRFTCETSRGLGRYLRECVRYRLRRVSALWLGVRRGPMTADGIAQVMEWRGEQAGAEVNPHKFRPAA